jgi:hypothetical protein
MHRPSTRSRGAANAAGFTYIGLLIAVVILGVALSAVGMVWRTQMQREREQELLYIGRDFRAANFPRTSMISSRTSVGRNRGIICGGSTRIP